MGLDLEPLYGGSAKYSSGSAEPVTHGTRLLSCSECGVAFVMKDKDYARGDVVRCPVCKCSLRIK